MDVVWSMVRVKTLFVLLCLLGALFVFMIVSDTKLAQLSMNLRTRQITRKVVTKGRMTDSAHLQGSIEDLCLHIMLSPPKNKLITKTHQFQRLRLKGLCNKGGNLSLNQINWSPKQTKKPLSLQRMKTMKLFLRLKIQHNQKVRQSL